MARVLGVGDVQHIVAGEGAIALDVQLAHKALIDQSRADCSRPYAVICWWNSRLTGIVDVDVAEIDNLVHALQQAAQDRRSRRQ